ncbi:thioesterase [Deltaproteobacteria bacterium]|nr:thioesterase [Deltaproteobacteria bacterium]
MKETYLAALRREDQNVNPLFAFLGATLDDAVEGEAVIALPISPRLAQGGGVVAGGILATLADEAMAHAVISRLEEGRKTVTLEMNIRYLRAVDPQKKGTLYAKGKVLKAGRAIVTVESSVYDDAGRLLAAAGGSFYILPAESKGKKDERARKTPQ